MITSDGSVPPGYAGTGHTQVEHPDGSQQKKAHKVGGETLPPPTAKALVGLSLGETLPTATKFHMIRIDVSVTIPCEPNEIDAVYDYAQEWVDQRITKLRAAVQEAYGQ